MKEIITKLRDTSGDEFAEGPYENSAADWQMLLAKIDVEYGSIPELLKLYLEECLFYEELPLPFNLYAVDELKLYLKGEFVQEAIKSGWFLIGHDDGDYICVSLKSGAPAQIPRQAIAEKEFSPVKSWKSLRDFFEALVNQEEQAAKGRKVDAKFENGFAVNPNALDSMGETTLMNTVGDLEAMERELKRGADPNVRAVHTKRTVLLSTVEMQDEAAVKLLLQHGAKVELKNSLHETPLYAAVTRKSRPLVRMLVEAGADLNVPACDNQTPFAYAVRKAPELVPFLLELGADPNAFTRSGDLPITYAVRDIPMLKLLFAHGAKTHLGDCRPIRKLYYPPERIAALRLFIEAGADVNDPRDALLSHANEVEFVQVLLDAGADPNLIDQHGRAALHTFLRAEHKLPADFKQKHLEMAKLLLENGADPNLVGEKGWITTPLIVAAQNGFVEAIQLLLEYGADANADVDGRTAFDVARTISPDKTTIELEELIEQTLAALNSDPKPEH